MYFCIFFFCSSSEATNVTRPKKDIEESVKMSPVSESSPRKVVVPSVEHSTSRRQEEHPPIDFSHPDCVMDQSIEVSLKIKTVKMRFKCEVLRSLDSP